MKKIIGIFLSFILFISSGIAASAAEAVPDTVLNAAESVVRIVAEYSDMQSTGTGFVIKNENGETLLATNYHVVAGEPQNIYTYIDDEIVYADIVVCTEQKDICILKLTDSTDLHPLKLAKESADRGEAIYALGFPGAADSLSDSFAHTSEDVTVTAGIISAIRELTTVSYGNPVRYLQITADINGGNSGGPLFNTKGEVVGINTLGVTDSQGIYGAIDISELKSFAEDNGIELAEKNLKGVGILVAATVLLIIVLIALIVLVVRTEKRVHHNKAIPETEIIQKKTITVHKKFNIKKIVCAAAVIITVIAVSAYALFNASLKKYAASVNFGDERVAVLPLMKLHDPELYNYLAAGNLLADKNYGEAKIKFSSMSGYLDADNMVLESDYRYAGYLADSGKFDDAVAVYRKLAGTGYKDSYACINEVYYRKACYIMEKNGDYLGAYKIIKSIKEFSEDKVLMAYMQELVYAQGQNLYIEGSYDAAYDYFFIISEYSDANKYLNLIKLRKYEDSPPNNISVFRNIIKEFYFADTIDLVLYCESVATEFLKGQWKTKDGANWLRIYDDGSSVYAFPEPEWNYQYYYVYRNEWRQYNNSRSDYKVLFSMSVIDYDTLKVLCHSDNKTYYLYRQ